MSENYADVTAAERPAASRAAASEPTADRLFTVPGTGLVVAGWIVTIIAVVLAAFLLLASAQNDEGFPFHRLILTAILGGFGLFIVLVGQLQRMTSVLAGRHKEPAPPTP